MARGSPEHGRVFLVGAGPGDPGLITVRAIECLSCAEVVIYDRLINNCILDYAPENAEYIYVGKEAAKHSRTQDEINRLIVAKAQEGKVVVRLKGGDPFIFGRGGEEALCLTAASVPFEVVPGVTSAVAVPTYAGIPLSMRGHNVTVTFITGHEDPRKEKSAIDWARLASDSGTLVFLMGVGNLAEIARRLVEHGMSPDTPTAVIMSGTMATQKAVTGTLTDIADIVKKESIEPPAIIVVGTVVGLRNELAWFEQRPLFGKSILITRASHQSRVFASELQKLGAHTEEFPTIEVLPPPDYAPLDHAIEEIRAFGWIIFTSVNAVHSFFDRFFQIKGDIRELGGIRIGAIGDKTREALQQYHLTVELCPRTFTSKGMLDEFKKQQKLNGQKILLPRSNLAPPFLTEELRKLRAEVIDPTLYHTRFVIHEEKEIIRQVEQGVFDIITFTSASTVEGFVKNIGKEAIGSLPEHVLFASIGPVTSEAAQQRGVPVAIEAEKHTMDGLIEAIVTNVNAGCR